MTSLALSLAALVSVAGAAQDLEPRAAQRLWACHRFLGELQPPDAGLRYGPVHAIGQQRFRAAWDAAWSARQLRPYLVEGGGDPLLGPPALAEAPDPRQELVILTTNALAADSEVLPRFMDMRSAEGWDVRLVTEADWDQSTGGTLDDLQERIRTWLQGEYLDDPGAFLLLIGDPHPENGDLPMKIASPFQPFIEDGNDDWLDGMDEIPTDYYYADLGGDWDCDGDGYAGEYPDDGGQNCIDWGPELYVGRLPVYDGADELDELLERLLEHDLEQDKTYRRNLLFGAAFLGFDEGSGGSYQDHDDSACVAAALYEDLPSEFQEGSTRLYEGEGIITSLYRHDGYLEHQELLDAWNEGRGFVYLSGHGWPEAIYRVIWEGDWDGSGTCSYSEQEWVSFVQSGDQNSLHAAPGAFTFNMSCLTGQPEEEDNLGRSFLDGGAVATVSASRSCWGTTAGYGEDWEPWPDVLSATTMGYYYVLEVVDGATLGEALAYTKHALPGDGWGSYNGVAWTTRFQFNLYGDPTRSLELCDADSDCQDDSPCNGIESCQEGFCVHSDPVDCSHLDSDCFVGRCEVGTGACYESARSDGALCDDGLWCTEPDSCQAGVCGGEPRVCGERTGHTAYCDEELEECLWEPIVEEGGCGCSAPSRSRGLLASLGAALALLLATAAGRRRRRSQ